MYELSVVYFYTVRTLHSTAPSSVWWFAAISSYSYTPSSSFHRRGSLLSTVRDSPVSLHAGHLDTTPSHTPSHTPAHTPSHTPTHTPSHTTIHPPSHPRNTHTSAETTNTVHPRNTTTSISTHQARGIHTNEAKHQETHSLSAQHKITLSLAPPHPPQSQPVSPCPPRHHFSLPTVMYTKNP